jgi:hypothetical protein
VHLHLRLVTPFKTASDHEIATSGDCLRSRNAVDGGYNPRCVRHRKRVFFVAHVLAFSGALTKYQCTGIVRCDD